MSRYFANELAKMKDLSEKQKHRHAFHAKCISLKIYHKSKDNVKYLDEETFRYILNKNDYVCHQS